MNALDKYRERARNDPRTADELLAEAAAAFIHRNSNEEALSDTYWDPVDVLLFRADDAVMAGARKLLSSASSADRTLAADVLAQVSVGNEAWETEALNLLLAAFERETNSEALTSMADAFGHNSDGRSIPLLLNLISHPRESVRSAVTEALSNQDDERIVPALIGLSSDPCDEVRHWATFGLGVLTYVNTPELRNALVARLNDPYEGAREPALFGLARRGDIRVVPALLKELESSSPKKLEESYLIIDAANAVIRAAMRNPDEKWCPLLEKLKVMNIGDTAEIQASIEACKHVGAP